jgi:ubiquinone/menaquinone biosynthesis C-methylase UbiE
MQIDISDETSEQRQYYERTAAHYNAMHINPDDEHGRALSVFMALAELSGHPKSVLDVGAGTGRAVRKIKSKWPTSKIIGVEPSDALREEAYKAGLEKDEMVSGNALSLDSFDYVIETGVLHHISDPIAAVREMVRVAKNGVMISDSNNIGQGSSLSRLIKYIIKSIGLWPALVWIQTGGKMYKTSEGDGVFYSFSAFDCIEAIREKFPRIYYLNTEPCAGFNLYRGTSHVMILARK